MPPRRAPRPAEPQHLICRHWYVSESLIKTRLFGVAETSELDNIAQRAEMVRCTMMDQGDYSNYGQYCEYEQQFRPQWPQLYQRWVANKDHADGVEWAVFDKVGRIEFVRKGGRIVTDSIVFPNQYALGPQ